jgi:hypothetical protein
MSAEANPPGGSSAPNESLQFERAEFSQAAALSCAFCKTPISGGYFQINGQTSCPACRDQIETAMAGGAKISRVLWAVGAGAAAGVAGFLVYWGIRATTGYEFGLVAILVGWMVGMAVRWGSQHRGGWFYQLMAVALTYFSIASTYCPDILQEMRQARTEQFAAESARGDSNAKAPQAVALNAEESVASPRATPPDGEANFPFWFELTFAFLISLAAPFLMGAGNFIGWIIIAFGLIQAWSLNKRPPCQVTGPFDATGQTSRALQP